MKSRCNVQEENTVSVSGVVMWCPEEVCFTVCVTAVFVWCPEEVCFTVCVSAVFVWCPEEVCFTVSQFAAASVSILWLYLVVYWSALFVNAISYDI